MKKPDIKKEVALFNPAELSLVIDSVIKTNTLPECQEKYKAWIKTFDASALRTDDDFMDAFAAVETLKSAETTLKSAHDKIITGEANKAITALEEMLDEISKKRREYEKAIETKRKDRINETLNKASIDLAAELGKIQYAHNINAKEALTPASKHQKSIAGLEKSLKKAADEIIKTETEYSAGVAKIRADITAVYAKENEVITEFEIDNLVSLYGNMAVEHAKLNLSAKQVAKREAELNAAAQTARAMRGESGTAPAAEPVKEQAVETEKPEDWKLTPAPQAAPVNALETAVSGLMGAPVKKTYRFGVTFCDVEFNKVYQWLKDNGGENIQWQEK